MKNHVIYQYYFTKEKADYFGRTDNVERRRRQHEEGKADGGNKVLTHWLQQNKKDPGQRKHDFKVILEDLSEEEAKRKEIEKIRSSSKVINKKHAREGCSIYDEELAKIEKGG